MDTDLERLYVATREGMVIIFDVKDPKQPVMVHAVRIIKPDRSSNRGNRQPADFVKHMDLD